MNLSIEKKEVFYINSKSRFARVEFSDLLVKQLSKYYSGNYTDLVIICIGTDRSTGDSLGPLVGHKISNKLSSYPDVHTFGTLNNPVHAKNLQANIQNIYSSFEKPFVIAIDACLGSFDKIGFISISNIPLKPGSGVHKILPKVGDVSILAMVNTSGFMEHMVLQSTRLSLVMTLADIISQSLVSCLWKLNHEKQIKLKSTI